MTRPRGRSRSGTRTQTGDTGRRARPRSELRRNPAHAELAATYAALLEEHGPQQWWPHADEDGRFEICLGAILTQNTAWTAAARALENLRTSGAWSPEGIAALPQDAVAGLVRPSGHFNVKARKVQEFCRVLAEDYESSVDRLLDGEPDELRARLLGIWGIGPETADAITLYAGRKPTFVVDTYTYRLLERLDLMPHEAPGRRRYEAVRHLLLDHIGPDVERLNEWHALIVRHGQRICTRSNPRCDQCPLLDACPFGQQTLGLRA